MLSEKPEVEVRESTKALPGMTELSFPDTSSLHAVTGKFGISSAVAQWRTSCFSKRM